LGAVENKRDFVCGPEQCLEKPETMESGCEFVDVSFWEHMCNIERSTWESGRKVQSLFLKQPILRIMPIFTRSPRHFSGLYTLKNRTIQKKHESIRYAYLKRPCQQHFGLREAAMADPLPGPSLTRQIDVFMPLSREAKATTEESGGVKTINV
jgi:hypothetical protein